MTTKFKQGDKVHSYAPAHYNKRGEITEILAGSRALVRLYSGETVTICIPDLELL